MRKALAIALLFLLALTTCSSYIGFMLQRSAIKQGITQLLAQSRHLSVIKLTQAQYASIVWIDDKEEFRYQGVLYDVKQINQSANGVEITAMADGSETELINDFLSTLTNNNQPVNDNGPVKHLLENLQKVFIEPLQVIAPFIPTKTVRLIPSTLDMLCSVSQHVLTPPPDGALFV